MKKCIGCKRGLPLDDFHNKKSSKDGKQGKCKSCNNSAARKWQEENPKKFEENWRRNTYGDDNRLRRRARTYGLSVEELTKMLDDSNGICNICKREPSRWLVIDHCHDTLRVRGVLCEKCNQGLGLFNDNIEFLKSAIEYLSK